MRMFKHEPLFLEGSLFVVLYGIYILVQHRNVNILYQNVSDKSIVNLNRFDLMEPNETDRLGLSVVPEIRYIISGGTSCLSASVTAWNLIIVGTKYVLINFYFEL